MILPRRHVIGGAAALAGTATLGRLARPARAAVSEFRMTEAGGASGDSIQAGYIEPFTGKTGIKVVRESPSGLGKLRAMVEARSITSALLELSSPELEQAKALDLVEADHLALACARRNVTDPRAAFHWADATRFRPERRYDAVVTNPPFHTGRAAEPGLGVAFITAAAAALAPQGALWLVANRQLPYEAALTRLFREVREIGGDKGFKVLSASGVVNAPRSGA